VEGRKEASNEGTNERTNEVTKEREISNGIVKRSVVMKQCNQEGKLT
jgi:hypothetical protein